MALPSKKNIDFNVYERQDPESQVDWGKAASDITKTFEGIRDTRQERKADLEKNITEQQTALNDIGEYDSPTLRQVALDSSQQSADELAKKADQMRRGLLRPNDLMKFKSNQSAGWTQFKNNAENWNAKFVEYTERMQGDPPPGSQLEMQLAQSLEGFGNLKNLKLLTDDDGNMSYARVGEDGEIKAGESMSVNEMTNLMNQKIDNYDVPKAVMSIKEELGTIITATIDPDGIRTDITTEEMSRAESDYFSTEAGQETLRLKALEMTSVPQNLAVMMTQDVRMPDGELYQGDFGGKKHDAWAKENPDKDQSLNPYIAMRFDGNRYVPDVTAEQKEAGNKYAEKIIKTALDVKQTAKSQHIEKRVQPQPSAASITKGDKDATLLSKGKNVMFAVSGDEEESKAGIQYLVDASNGNISGIEKTETGFIVQYPDSSDGKEVAPYEKNTEGMTPEESMRAMWKAAGLLDSEFDAWLNVGGNDLLVDRETTRDVQNIKGPQTKTTYDMNATFPNAEGLKVTATDWINNSSLGESLNSLNDDNIEVTEVFTELLTKESFFPKDLNGSVRMDGNTMYFTIDNKEYKVDDDVFAMDTGDIVIEMQKIIQDSVNKNADGGNASQYDKKKEDE